MPALHPAAVKKPLLWLLVPVTAGVLLHSYELFKAMGTGNNSFAIGLLAWSALPYAVALALAGLRVRPSRAAGFAWASLVGSLYMHYVVFVQPTGSTAALGLLFMPLWNLLLLGPIGLLVVWGLEASSSGNGSNAA